MEEFINGELLSYDGIADSKKNIIFETAHAYPIPIMDVVNEHKDVMSVSYTHLTLPTNSRV